MEQSNFNDNKVQAMTVQPCSLYFKVIKTVVISVVLIMAVLIGVAVPLQAQSSSLGNLFGKDNNTENGKFLKVDQAFTVTPSQQADKLFINLKITPEHYIYKDKIKLNLPKGVSASALTFSKAATTIDDPIFGKVPVFKQNKVTVSATLTNNSSTPINKNVSISWQGCAEAGLCYPPQTESLTINLPAKPKATPTEASNSKAQTSSSLNKTSSSVTEATKKDQEKAKIAESQSKQLNSIIQPKNSNSDTPTSLVAELDDTSKQQLIDDNDNMIAAGDEEENSEVAPELNATDDQILEAQDDTNQNINANTNSNTNSSIKRLNLGDSVNQDPFGLAQHPFLALGLLFLAGLALAFTPCVLPMLPIVSNIVARQHEPTAKKGLLLSGGYALGVAVAYGILGAIIAIFGESLGIIGWLQNPVILIGFAIVFVLLALYMLDLFTLPLPNTIRTKMQSVSQKGDKYLGSTFGSFIAGLFSALVVSPCVSAPLFGALLAVSTIGNPFLGFAALFMLGFGLSSPLILLGVSQGNLMPKAGDWMNWVKQGFALALFAVALLLIERILINPIMLMFWSLWFIVVALWAWSWCGRGKVFTKALALVCGIWATTVLVGAAAGSLDAWQPLAIFATDAQLPQINNNSTSGDLAVATSDIHLTKLDELISLIEQNDKVLVDVTAEWCIECRIMDKTLFTNRPNQLQHWKVVKLDVTETNDDARKIYSELNLVGPPALLYFVNGELKEQQVGTVERADFESTLNRF